MTMSLMDFNDPSTGSTIYGSTHPNPHFDYLTSFLPRKLKDVFKWSEYLAYNSAHIHAVVKKFGEYPITRLVYHTSSPGEKKRHEELLERKLHLKAFLTKVSFDKHIYGNCFVSVVEPIKRWLTCKHCSTREDATVANYEFVFEKTQFILHCRQCGVKGEAAVHDQKLPDPSKINLIRWDPKLMDIMHNPITGQSVYYYTIPRTLIQQVKDGNRLQIDTMPMAMLKAMRASKPFRFAPDQIYHIRVAGPAGVEVQWGFPPITSAIKLFLFAATLRRANEAIALEHITPFRVIHPEAASAQGDPLLQLNLADWRRELEHNLKLFRKDPLRIQISPVPIGVQNVGGDGRALMTIAELQEAEKTIVLSMGVPMEFLAGGFGNNRSDPILRMIETQLQTHIDDLNGLIQWIEQKCAKFANWTSIPTRLADFKILDDLENKQMYFQLWQAGKISDSRLGEMLGIDWALEGERINEDRLAQTRRDIAFEAAQRKLTNALSQQAQSQSQMAQSGGNYDQQSIIANADAMAQEFAGLDAGTKRSRLESLKAEDFVMYAVVVQRLEQINQDRTQAAKTQTG